LSARFEELAWRDTAMGAISLRRRLEPALDVDVYEVKLGDEYLMSSLFTVAEIELARLGLAQVSGTGLDVVVGGLGLGYTAQAVLADPRVGSLVVVEALAEVIDWHRRDLLPDTAGLASDPRTRLQQGDFFAMAESTIGFDPASPGRRFDAILLDIDHTPRHVLHSSHAALYTAPGLARLAGHLQPGGVFALWSDDPPDDQFDATLAETFARTDARVITFPNPLTGGTSANTVYLASEPISANPSDGRMNQPPRPGPADLALMVEFLTAIGLDVRLEPIEGRTVLPGVTVDRGALVIDEAALAYVGDVLHEAGHVAVTPLADRAALVANVGDDGGFEMAALAWSYAAARHLGIDAAVVFHDAGYLGGAAALRENFEQGRYLGVPILVWRGLTTERDYPTMARWLAG
jgi:spermidine synthase